MIKQLKHAHIMLSANRLKVLGAGVPLPSIQVACIEIDMGHPSLTLMARAVKEGTSDNEQAFSQRPVAG